MFLKCHLSSYYINALGTVWSGRQIYDEDGCRVDADAVGFGVCFSVGVVVER